MPKIPLLIAALVLSVSGLSFGGTLDILTKEIDPGGAETILYNCDLGAGQFTIRPDDMTEAAVVKISYDPRQLDPVVDFEVKGDKCYVDLETDHHRSSDVDTEDNLWDISLSTRYSTKLRMDIGACDADFDLSGIPVTELSVDVGAASGSIEFNKPNPAELEEIDIDAGASSLDLKRIGNANFRHFNFSGGAGSFDLDFTGEYRGESEINIEVGLGSLDIILPVDIPVRIVTEDSNWLSSVDLHDDDLDEVEDDVYQSAGFEGATRRIVLTLEVGLGSADIYFK